MLIYNVLIYYVKNAMLLHKHPLKPVLIDLLIHPSDKQEKKVLFTRCLFFGGGGEYTVHQHP